MQNPVIQRIKRRAEVCQSLPVTCGRRGNDTGNGMVTVGSIQCAVDCFPENGKSPHSKPVTFLLPPAAKCRSGMFFTLCPPYVRLHGGRIRNADRRSGQDPRTFEHQHDPPLRQIFRDGDQPRNGGFRRKTGFGCRGGRFRVVIKASLCFETLETFRIHPAGLLYLHR